MRGEYKINALLCPRYFAARPNGLHGHSATASRLVGIWAFS